MSVYLAPTFGIGWQGFTVGGLPLNSGLLYTYIAGGTTPQATYTTYLGNVQNSNPIVLGADGRPPNEIWLTSGVSYRFDLNDSSGNLIKTYDNVSMAPFTFAADLASTTRPTTGATLVGVNRNDGVATDLESVLDTYSFLRGNQTPSAGSLMKIDLLRESNTDNPLQSLGAMWAGNTYTYAGVSKEFTLTDGAANSPCAAFTAYALNNNSNSDAVGALVVSKAWTSNDVAFGSNIVATSNTGITTPKLVGLEIDVEPATGVTAASGSGALFINAFNSAIPGPAIQTGGASSGTFANGIIFNSGIASAGTCLGAGSITVDSFWNTSNGTFNTSAGILGNTHRIQFRGTAAAHAYLYNDSTNALRIVGGSSSTAVRNNADTTTTFALGDSGILGLCSTGTINWDSALSSTTANAGGQTLPAQPQGFITIQVAGTNRKIPYYQV